MSIFNFVDFWTILSILSIPLIFGLFCRFCIVRRFLANHLSCQFLDDFVDFVYSVDFCSILAILSIPSIIGLCDYYSNFVYFVISILSRFSIFGLLRRFCLYRRLFDYFIDFYFKFVIFFSILVNFSDFLVNFSDVFNYDRFCQSHRFLDFLSI